MLEKLKRFGRKITYPNNLNGHQHKRIFLASKAMYVLLKIAFKNIKPIILEILKYLKIYNSLITAYRANTKLSAYGMEMRPVQCTWDKDKAMQLGKG